MLCHGQILFYGFKGNSVWPLPNISSLCEFHINVMSTSRKTILPLLGLVSVLTAEKCVDGDLQNLLQNKGTTANGQTHGAQLEQTVLHHDDPWRFSSLKFDATQHLQNSDASASKVQGHTDTFAVLSRMWRGDLPHLESWLRHYILHLAVQRVYGVVTDPDDLTDLRALILRAGFGDQVKLFSEPINEDSVNTAIFDPAQIAETFVLSVDTDEFAVLPVGESLQSFTASEPFADFFQMVWRCAPSDTIGEQFTPRIGILCKNAKPMFRTRRFQRFNTPHVIFCEPPTQQEEGEGMQMYSMDERNCRRAQKSLALMHFWYRGVYDALLRQSAGHTTGDFSDRNTGVEVVLDELRNGILPQRLKHLAIGAVCEDLLETTTNSERSKFREIYGEDNTSFRLKIFINQTEAIDQLDFLGIDEELRRRAIEKYNQFKAAFAKDFEKIVCEPLKFCTVPITPSMHLAKSLTVEGMQNFDEPCKQKFM